MHFAFSLEAQIFSGFVHLYYRKSHMFSENVKVCRFALKETIQSIQSTANVQNGFGSVHSFAFFMIIRNTKLCL